MIVSCDNCHKKFDIKSSLIPEKGRLLQCNSCNYKWFFKKEIFENTTGLIVDDIENDSVNIFDQNNPTNNVEINPSDLPKEEVSVEADVELEKKIEPNINKDINVKSKAKKPKNFKVTNIFIVTTISFVAFIIIVDTFKNHIGKVVPNIEFILYNLYESIKDISLFIRDLT